MAQVSICPAWKAFCATAKAETLTDGFPDLESNWAQDPITVMVHIMSVKAEIISDDSPQDIEKGAIQNAMSFFATTTARAILMPFARPFLDDFCKRVL